VKIAEEIAEERANSFPRCVDHRNTTKIALFQTPELQINSNISNGDKTESINQWQFKESRTVLENVTIHSSGSVSKLLSVINNLEEEIILRNDETEFNPMLGSQNKELKYPIRLVILDSIAAPAKKDFGVETSIQRVAKLFQIAQTLNRIADQLQVAVVVINQVGRVGYNEYNSVEYNSIGDGEDFVSLDVALGTSYAHCVSTRLLLEHERDPHRLNSRTDTSHATIIKTENKVSLHDSISFPRHAWMSERGHVRTARIVKSNIVGHGRMSYVVTKAGLCEL